MKHSQRSFEQQSKAVLDADLQQRQSQLDANIERARKLRAANTKTKPSFGWRPAYSLAAAAVAAAVALPLYLSQPTATGSQLAVADTELLNELDLALWLADAGEMEAISQ